MEAWIVAENSLPNQRMHRSGRWCGGWQWIIDVARSVILGVMSLFNLEISMFAKRLCPTVLFLASIFSPPSARAQSNESGLVSFEFSAPAKASMKMDIPFASWSVEARIEMPSALVGDFTSPSAYTTNFLIIVVDDPETFPNQKPDDLEDEKEAADGVGAKPVKVTDDSVKTMVNEGKIKFVVKKNGDLIVCQHTIKTIEISHAVLANGEDVLTAGEADISHEDGKFVGISIDNNSGHYKPSAESLEIAIKKFKEAGIEFPEDADE